MAKAREKATKREASDKQMVPIKKLWPTTVPVASCVSVFVKTGDSMALVYRDLL